MLNTEVNVFTTGVVDEFKAYVAGTHLRDPAAAIFQNLIISTPTTLKWDELKSELLKTFEPVNLKSLNFNQLIDLK